MHVQSSWATLHHITHPGLVMCIVLQAKQVAPLSALQGRGCRWRQQVGWLGDHGWVRGRGECSCQREALQLPLSLLLQHLAHHHLLLLADSEGEDSRLIRRSGCVSIKTEGIYSLSMLREFFIMNRVRCSCFCCCLFLCPSGSIRITLSPLCK